MSENVLKMKKMNEKTIIPSYQTDQSAGMDLTVIDYKRKENDIVSFSTGLSVQIPENCFGMLCIRSGLGIKGNWILANSQGIIDSDYTGEVKIFLKYLGENDIQEEIVSLMETRVAQLIIVPYVKVEMKVVEKLNETERGEGGFGSTGK